MIDKAESVRSPAEDALVTNIIADQEPMTFPD